MNRTIVEFILFSFIVWHMLKYIAQSCGQNVQEKSLLFFDLDGKHYEVK